MDWIGYLVDVIILCRIRSPKCGDKIYKTDTRPIQDQKIRFKIRINQKEKKRKEKSRYSQFNLNLVATRKIRDFVVY